MQCSYELGKKLFLLYILNKKRAFLPHCHRFSRGARSLPFSYAWRKNPISTNSIKTTKRCCCCIAIEAYTITHSHTATCIVRAVDEFRSADKSGSKALPLLPERSSLTRIIPIYQRRSRECHCVGAWDHRRDEAKYYEPKKNEDIPVTRSFQSPLRRAK